MILPSGFLAQLIVGIGMQAFSTYLVRPPAVPARLRTAEEPTALGV